MLLLATLRYTETLRMRGFNLKMEKFLLNVDKFDMLINLVLLPDKSVWPMANLQIFIFFSQFSTVFDTFCFNFNDQIDFTQMASYDGHSLRLEFSSPIANMTSCIENWIYVKKKFFYIRIFIILFIYFFPRNK